MERGNMRKRKRSLKANKAVAPRKPGKKYPEVHALLGALPNDDAWFWLVDCPYCEGLHDHDGGPLDSDPREKLGVFLAPCSLKAEKLAYYRLVNPRAGLAMRRLWEELARNV
jgi:hypothetical protein